MTFTKGALLTLAIVPALSYQPILEQRIPKTNVRETIIPVQNNEARGFNPNYIMIDNRVEEMPRDISNELVNVTSMITIGNIIFEGSRNESPEELKAMKSYFKNKYKKV